MRPIVNMPDEDQAMDIGSKHKKLERSRVWVRRYPRGQKDTQTDILITILRKKLKKFTTIGLNGRMLNIIY